jgi:hypothetical protein
MARHGFGFRFQVITETAQQYGSRWATAVVCVLLVIAAGLLIVPWNSIFPPDPVVNVSQSLPAPSPSPAAPSPSLAPTPTSVIQVNGYAGSVCIVPTNKAKRPITLVKVP